MTEMADGGSARTSARGYLVSYDIACPKRWRRVVRLVEKVGERRQYSVFFCRMTLARRNKLERALRRVLNDTEDRLMVIDLGPIDAAWRNAGDVSPAPNGKGLVL